MYVRYLKVNSPLVYDGSKTSCGTCTLDSLHGVDTLDTTRILQDLLLSALTMRATMYLN